MILPLQSWATSEWTVQIGKSIKKFDAKLFGGVSHISSEQIKKYVLKDSKYKKSQKRFDSKEYSLKYNVGSFFLAFEDWSGTKVVQLSAPVTLLKGKHYLPAKSFFRSLDTLGLFTISFSLDSRRAKGQFVILADREFLALKPLPRKSNNLGKIKKDRDGNLYFKSSGSVGESPFSDAFVKLSKKLAVSLKNYKPSLVEIYSPPILEVQSEIIEAIPFENKNKSTPYIIPKGLIRKELEELQRK
jgi:hypothetical protein